MQITWGRPFSVSFVCQEKRWLAPVAGNVCSRMTAGQVPIETPFRSHPSCGSWCPPGGEIGACIHLLLVHIPTWTGALMLVDTSSGLNLIQLDSHWLHSLCLIMRGHTLPRHLHHFWQQGLKHSLRFSRAAAQGAGLGHCCAGRAGVSRQPLRQSANKLRGYTLLCQINK